MSENIAIENDLEAIAMTYYIVKTEVIPCDRATSFAITLISSSLNISYMADPVCIAYIVEINDRLSILLKRLDKGTTTNISAGS